MVASLKKGLNAIRSFTLSIRFRITMWSTAVLAVILVIFCVFVYIRQSNDLQIETSNQLQIKTQQLTILYRVSGLMDPEHDHFQAPDLVIKGSGLISNREELVLVGADGSVLQSAGNIQNKAADQILTAWSQANQVDIPLFIQSKNDLLSASQSETKYLYLITPLFAEGRPLGLIILGQPVDVEGQLPKLLVTLILGSLLTIFISLAGGYWFAAKAMAPVRTITRTARGISETGLHKRLNLDTKDELGELANTFDAMLDRLQAAFDRQRKFTADASHELRTPLTIIGLETDQALSHRRSPEENERAFKVIRSENEAMSRLVNDMLMLARMDAGQAIIRKECLDLSDVALDVMERMSSLACREGIEIQVGDVPEVKVNGDYQYLSQMLANLVQNAVKYAGGQGHTIQMDIGKENSGSESYAWVKVADDGPGISANHLPHLFNRFYQVAPSRDSTETAQDKVVDGSGLGLAIVQWIVEAHAGQVSVQSEPGKGTVFEIHLPLASISSS